MFWKRTGTSEHDLIWKAMSSLAEPERRYQPCGNKASLDNTWRNRVVDQAARRSSGPCLQLEKRIQPRSPKSSTENLAAPASPQISASGTLALIWRTIALVITSTRSPCPRGFRSHLHHKSPKMGGLDLLHPHRLAMLSRSNCGCGCLR